MNNSSSADEPARLPKDAIVVQTMLQEMGITNYEPKLIPMVLDFMHRTTPLRDHTLVTRSYLACRIHHGCSRRGETLLYPCRSETGGSRRHQASLSKLGRRTFHDAVQRCTAPPDYHPINAQVLSSLDSHRLGQKQESKSTATDPKFHRATFASRSFLFTRTELQVERKLH